MRHVQHIITFLPMYPWTYRYARLAFWILATSIVMSGVFYAFVYNPTNGCKTQIEQNVFVGVYTLLVRCQGFSFASYVEYALNLFLNLAPGSLVVMIMYFGGGMFTSFLTMSAAPPQSLNDVFLATGITLLFLVLDAFALLYALHLGARLWRYLDDRISL